MSKPTFSDNSATPRDNGSSIKGNETNIPLVCHQEITLKWARHYKIIDHLTMSDRDCNQSHWSLQYIMQIRFSYFFLPSLFSNPYPSYGWHTQKANISDCKWLGDQLKSSRSASTGSMGIAIFHLCVATAPSFCSCDIQLQHRHPSQKGELKISRCNSLWSFLLPANPHHITSA